MRISNRRLLLRVGLAGKRTRLYEDALIDTGASFTVISTEVAEYLGLEAHHAHPRTRLVTASGVIDAPIKVLNELHIAALTIESLPVVVHTIPDPAPIKILLGMNLLERMRLHINGKEGTFTLKDP